MNKMGDKEMYDKAERNVSAMCDLTISMGDGRWTDGEIKIKKLPGMLRTAFI